MKQNLMESAIGALVIAIALGFFIFMYSTTGVGKGSGGYPLTAKFKNVEGINVGSDIKMSGIKIGSVTNQTLDNQTFDAVLTLNKLRRPGARYSISATGRLPESGADRGVRGSPYDFGNLLRRVYQNRLGKDREDGVWTWLGLRAVFPIRNRSPSGENTVPK